MINFIVTAVAAILIVASGLMRNLWAGFSYFALVFCCLLSLYWAVIFIARYYDRFYRRFNDDFELYLAKVFNKTNLTAEQLEFEKKKHKKKFRRSQWKERGIGLLKIGFALGFFIACFAIMFR